MDQEIQDQIQDQTQTSAPSRKERYEFRITRQLLAHVEARAGREGVSRAEIVTRAIEAYLEVPNGTPATKTAPGLIDKIEQLKAELAIPLENREKNHVETPDS